MQAFDAVCCFAALHLFADPERALDRMTAVLTPGGRIAIFTTAGDRLGRCAPGSSLLARRSGMRVFERDEVADALGQRGFVEIRQRVGGVTQFIGGRLE